MSGGEEDEDGEDCEWCVSGGEDCEDCGEGSVNVRREKGRKRQQQRACVRFPKRVSRRTYVSLVKRVSR